MGDYATTAHVEAHLGNRKFGTTGIVTTAQADAWIDQAEREIIGTLVAAGGSSDYTADATHATLILRGWVSAFVAGLARRSYAAAAGDGQNDDGEDELNKWFERLEDIRRNPVHYVQMLTASASDSTNHLKAHSTSTDESSAKFKMTEIF